MKRTKEEENEMIEQVDDVPEVVEAIKTEAIELPKLRHSQLHDTLMYIQDKLERSTINFVVLGDIARQVKDEDVPQLSADRVHIGVLKKDLTESGFSMLKTLIPGMQVSENQLGYVYKEVPIIIDIIKGDYEFFDYPDSHFYYTADLKLPNPFDKYWEMRDKVV